MTRGGYREGSGGKSKWKHGKTKTIRVPEALAEQILEYARNIDEGKKFIVESEIHKLIEKTPTKNTPNNVIDLTGVSLVSLSGQMGVRLKDLVKKGYQLKPSTLDRFISIPPIR